MGDEPGGSGDGGVGWGGRLVVSGKGPTGC